MRHGGEVRELASASIELENYEGRIERLRAGEDGQEIIRFSLWREGSRLPCPLELTEKELVTLLQAALRSGALSQGFYRMLRSDVEI